MIVLKYIFCFFKCFLLQAVIIEVVNESYVRARDFQNRLFDFAFVNSNMYINKSDYNIHNRTTDTCIDKYKPLVIRNNEYLRDI